MSWIERDKKKNLNHISLDDYSSENIYDRISGTIGWIIRVNCGRLVLLRMRQTASQKRMDLALPRCRYAAASANRIKSTAESCLRKRSGL